MSEFGLTCVVALERMAYLDPVRMGRAIHALAPSRSVQVFDRGHSPGESGILVRFDGHAFAMMAIDGRLPEPEFSPALAANPFWPDAQSVMARHEAFVIVTAAEPATEPADNRAQAASLTRLAGVLSEVLPVLGFYWQGASAAVPPQRVRQAIGDLNQNKWPGDLWIGYEFRGRDTEGGLFTGVRSKGALPYLGVEVDIPPRHVRDTAEILRYLYHAINDLLTRGRKIRDGEAVRMTNPREAWHQVRYVSHGEVPIVALRELEEPIWGMANVST